MTATKWLHRGLRSPAEAGDFLVLTAIPTDTPDRKEVYELDPTNKVAERMTYYQRSGDGWKQVRLVEHLSEPVDPKVFDHDLPKDIVKCDQINQKIGLEKGNLTD